MRLVALLLDSGEGGAIERNRGVCKGQRQPTLIQTAGALLFSFLIHSDIM